MRVVVAPVVADGRIYRVVAPVQSLLEVEEWVGQWWEPSVMPLTLVSLWPAAEIDWLTARGVPLADCVASEPRPAQDEIEASLVTSDPERSPAMQFDAAVHRGDLPTRRAYPGNGRFRRRARGS